MRKIRMSYRDYCPELDDIHGIGVDFIEVPIIWANGPGYKKSGMLCDHFRECSIAGGKDLNCPLFSQCPNP